VTGQAPATRAIVGPDSIPRLAPHMKLRLDKARDSWTIQAPERSFMLDPIAHQVVSRCDGIATVGGVIEDLCRSFPDAPADVIEADVIKMIQDLADKGVLAL
jgi:pyrroloquinoline quinone biosynthesis protein D